MAGETITFQDTSPQGWQNLLQSVVKGASDIAVARLGGQDDRVKQVQQAPVATNELRSWLPWILGGAVLVAIVAVIVRR